MQFYITYKMNNKVLDWEVPIPDPFIRAVVNISWWDRFRSLFKGKDFEVEVLVNGDKETLFKVMNLDRADFSLIMTGRASSSAVD